MNVLLVAPALTVTLAGTDAAAELSDSVTTAPPAGAGALSETVPVDEAPPVTVVGLTVSAVKVGRLGRRHAQRGEERRLAEGRDELRGRWGRPTRTWSR